MPFLLLYPMRKSAGEQRTLSRLGSIADLILVLGTLEGYLWYNSRDMLPRWGRTAGAVALVVSIGILLWRQRPDRTTLGLAPKSWTSGLGLLFGLTLFGMGLIAAGGLYFDTWGQVSHFGRWLGRNWYLEGAQQLLLQVLMVPRLEVILNTRGARVSALAATFFAALHAPNLPLVVLTLLAGYVWCEWFRRHRNMPAVWLSHFLLGATTLYCLNGPWLGNMRVGINYPW